MKSIEALFAATQHAVEYLEHCETELVLALQFQVVRIQGTTSHRCLPDGRTVIDQTVFDGSKVAAIQGVKNGIVRFEDEQDQTWLIPVVEAQIELAA